MKYFEGKHVVIEYLEDMQIGLGTWNGLPEDSEYKEGLNKQNDLIKEKKIKNWIANLSNMDAVSDELVSWTTKDWTPRAVVSGLKNMAIIISSDVFNQLTSEQIMNTITGSITTKYFSNMNDPKKWIETLK